MTCARYFLMLCAASLVTAAQAQTDQAKLARDCEAEIEKAERQIADARRNPAYKSEKGKATLTTADRYLNQARTHAAKGETRSCATAAKKGRTQLSTR